VKKTYLQEELKTLIEDNIFKNKLVFEERYDPDIIYHRDKEMKEILYFFKTAHESTDNIDLVGVTGTGKTAIIKQIAKIYSNIAKESKIKCVYVNCKTDNTKTKILVRIAEGIGDGIKTTYYNAVSIINQKLNHLLGLVIILDEVDKVLQNNPEGGNDLLYILSDKPKISLVNISNTPNWRDLIKDQRVISRMPPNQLLFNPYTQKELFDILEDRVSHGFKDGACSNEVIDYVSTKVAEESGNVRSALKIIKKTGEMAAASDRTKINMSDVVISESRVTESDVTVNYINGLQPQKKALLISIYHYYKKYNEHPTANDILKVYNMLVKNSKHLHELKLPSIRSYLTELSTYNLIDSKGSKYLGRGKGSTASQYWITMNDELFEEEFYKPMINDDKGN